MPKRRQTSKRPRRKKSRSQKGSSNDGFYFDRAAADRACQFIEGLLEHWQGEWSGRPFILAEWERTAVRAVFGWKRKDGTRRYRTVYIEVPKKNGKTMLAAAIALALLFMDPEPGAEIYSAAADRRQAEIVFTDARMMLESSGPLASRAHCYRRSIFYARKRSRYEVLSADVPTKHGLKPSAIIIDELHAQPDRTLLDTLKRGMVHRRQPLLVMITTAGEADEEHVCFQEHEYAAAVLSGDIEDPTYYALIYGADPDDDWEDPRVWRKANPSLGITVKEEALAEAVRKAKHTPSEQASFKRLHLNIWLQTSIGAIDPQAWKKCRSKPRVKAGDRCFVGMDLSSKLDLTSVVALFPHKDGSYSVLPYFWIPEENLEDRKRREVFDYPRHVANGYIETTSGNWIDQEAIRKRVNELAETYELVDLGFDPWNASQIATWLQDEDGINIVELRQGTKTMSEPFKRLVGLIADKKIRHGNNPVLTWNARNLVARRDPNDNWAPRKNKKGRKRIDGMVALIMAMHRAIAYETDGEVGPAVYTMGSA